VTECHWNDVIVLNVHAPTENKRDDTKAAYSISSQRTTWKFS